MKMTTEIPSITFHVYGNSKQQLEDRAEEIAKDFFGEGSNPMIVFISTQEDDEMSDGGGNRLVLSWRAEVRATNAA